MEFNHVPVLLDECIECLNIKEGGVYVDGTLGGGGHSSCVLKRLNNTGILIGIDRDKEALAHTSVRLKEYTNVTYVNDTDYLLDEAYLKEVIEIYNKSDKYTDEVLYIYCILQYRSRYNRAKNKICREYIALIFL